MFSTCVVPATFLLSRQPGLAQLLSFPTCRTTILTQECAHNWSKPKNELIFPSERKKQRAKEKSSFLCPSFFAIGESQTTDERTETKTECDVYGRKLHWACVRDVQCLHPVCLRKPGASSSNDDTTAPLQPTGEGHNVFRSQRLQ